MRHLKTLFSTMLVLATSALVVIPGAHAGQVRSPDAEGDVRQYHCGGDPYRCVWRKKKAPNVDIVSAGLRFKDGVVTTWVKVADIDVDVELEVFYRTPERKAHRYATIFTCDPLENYCSSDGHQGITFGDPRSNTSRACAGKKAGWNDTTNVIKISIPSKCLGNPEWVAWNGYVASGSHFRGGPYGDRLFAKSDLEEWNETYSRRVYDRTG